jgi:hypothetical protein
MSEAQALLSVLRQVADATVAAAIERHVKEAPDRELSRMNVVDFAARHGLEEERTVSAFLHGARLGLFEMSWNVLCPGCGGVLDSNATLKSVHREEYACALCAAGYEATLDEMVEVAFTVNPRVRRIAAHDPDALPFPEYLRQIFWSSGIDLPEDKAYKLLLDKIVIDRVELPAGEKAIRSLQLPDQFCIVFDPVTHSTQFLDVRGDAGASARTSPWFSTSSGRLPKSWRCGPGLYVSSSITAPTCAFCRPCGSRDRICMTSWASGNRS